MVESEFGLLAQAPVINGTYVLYVMMRILHILSAIILVGGLFYTKTVLVPAGADPFAGQRQVWARWVGLASMFLLVSGLVNFMNNMNLAKAHEIPLPPTYHMLFGIKFLLGLFVMFLAAILSGKTALAEKFRQKMGRWLGIAWTASLAIVIIGAILRTFPR
jgi:putative copper export protein